MELVDTNVWLALAIPEHALHGAAISWLAAQRGQGMVLLCRATQQSLLRLLTTESVMQRYQWPAMTNAAAWEYYEKMATDPRVAWAAEPSGVDARWKTLAARPTASPKMWMDAYLAAFAMAGGHRLVTTDKAMTQYAPLDVVILTTERGASG
jgi:uncharacterized protein